MISGLDSAYAPSAASLISAKKAGVKLWCGYFGGPNIYHGWSQNDFVRVKESGLSTLAFCSGWSDPTSMHAQSVAWGIPICLDVEGGIRGNGSWVQPWLNASGAGLYGNGPVFAGHRAAFYILAGYPTLGDPYDLSWNTAYAPRPAGPCGWQWAGTHSAYGATVDSGWYDDFFGNPTFSLGSGSLGDEHLDLTNPVDKTVYDAAKQTEIIHQGLFGGDPSVLQPPIQDRLLAIQTALGKLTAPVAASVDLSGIQATLAVLLVRLDSQAITIAGIKTKIDKDLA